MNSEMEKPLWKSIAGWFLLTTMGAIIGSLVTFMGSNFIYPAWAKITSYVFGNKCCYTVRDPLPVQIFANQMTKLIKTGYVISFAPEASNVKIASGSYGCQETYLAVTRKVLDRNNGNLSYRIDNKNKVIHITLRESR